MYSARGHAGKNNHITFNVFLPCLTFRGPMRSTPVAVKGGRPAVTLASGRLAMLWAPTPVLQRRHLKQACKTRRTAARPRKIQKLLRMQFNTRDVPLWPSLLWYRRINISVTGCFVGRITGCLLSKGRLEFWKPPSILMMPFKTNGFKCLNCWRLGTLLDFFSDSILLMSVQFVTLGNSLTASGKASHCTNCTMASVASRRSSAVSRPFVGGILLLEYFYVQYCLNRSSHAVQRWMALYAEQRDNSPCR